jgi:NTP pyrophosphatase (non-canonical NTP hydrolase)
MFKKIIYVFIVLFNSMFSGESMNLKEMQKFQQDYDAEHFEINSGFEKLRHLLLHLVKTTGKMATYCESMEHGKETNSAPVIHEVLPDLLIHALQIANYYGIDLSVEYDERIQFLINRSK